MILPLITHLFIQIYKYYKILFQKSKGKLYKIEKSTINFVLFCFKPYFIWLAPYTMLLCKCRGIILMSFKPCFRWLAPYTYHENKKCIYTGRCFKPCFRWLAPYTRQHAIKKRNSKRLFQTLFQMVGSLYKMVQ